MRSSLLPATASFAFANKEPDTSGRQVVLILVGLIGAGKVSSNHVKEIRETDVMTLDYVCSGP